MHLFDAATGGHFRLTSDGDVPFFYFPISKRGGGKVLKLRLMGRTNDIKWYRKILDRDSRVRVIEHSQILPLGNSGRYFRGYSQVERTDKK